MEDIKGRTISTTETSLAILELIQRRDGVRIGELTAELGVAKSTVHGHLATLQRKEYVVKEGNTYRLGLKLFNLGESAKQRDSRYRIVEEKVREFSAETSEELDFSVEENGRTIVLFDEIGSSMRPGFQVGDYFYMNTNAAGKAILAELSDDEVDDILERWGLPQETEHTITDRSRLFEELDTVRERGYATNNQENFEGIRAIGSSVIAPDGSVLGAMAISGPAYRLSMDGLHDLASDLLLYTEEIEARLRNPNRSNVSVQRRES